MQTSARKTLPLYQTHVCNTHILTRQLQNHCSVGCQPSCAGTGLRGGTFIAGSGEPPPLLLPPNPASCLSASRGQQMPPRTASPQLFTLLFQSRAFFFFSKGRAAEINGDVAAAVAVIRYHSLMEEWGRVLGPQCRSVTPSCSEKKSQQDTSRTHMLSHVLIF